MTYRSGSYENLIYLTATVKRLKFYTMKRNWFNIFFKSNNKTNRSNTFQTISSLLDFLLGKILDSSKIDQLRKNKVSKFNRYPLSQKLQELPVIYLFFEQYITKYQKNYTEENIRIEVKRKFPELISLTSLKLIFEESNQQKISLAICFLQNIIARISNVLGNTNNSMFFEIANWLIKFPNEITSPIPFGIEEYLSKNADSSYTLLEKISKKLYYYIQEQFGDDFSENYFQASYTEMAKFYKDLDNFFVVIQLLPEELLDGEKINLLSKRQIENVLIAKVNYFQDTNKKIEGKNEELKIIQEKLKLSEENLKITLERFESITKTVGEGIISINSIGNIIFVNDKINDIFGYYFGELINTNIKILMPNTYHKNHDLGLKHYLKTKEKKIIGKRMRLEGLHKSGRIFPIEIHINEYEHRGKLFFNAAIRDISDLVIREKRIEELALFPTENPLPVLKVDINFTLLYANHASEPILTYWNIKKGMNLPKEWHPKIIDSFILAKTKIEEEVFGDKIYKFVLAPVKKNNYVYIYAEDITQEKSFQSKITAQNDKIMSSIRYAKRIQTAILGDPINATLYFKDAFVLFKPMDVVSGDFYWHTEKDNKIIIIAADCTGHGVPGALMSIIGKDILDRIIKNQGVTDASKILTVLDNEITKQLNQHETNVNDGMDIALCIIDKKSKKLNFAGAKRPLIYIENDKINYIKGNKIAIGGDETRINKSYIQHEIDIMPETTFYIFSDGYSDQFGGKDNKKFMGNRFKKMIFSIHKKPMAEQKKQIDDVLINWLSHRKPIDDVLVIGFKVF